MLILDGLVSPNIRELNEMLYLWERPSQVDSSRFGDHFAREATTVDEGIQATVDWYRERGAVEVGGCEFVVFTVFVRCLVLIVRDRSVASSVTFSGDDGA
ncbi:MAG: hypothetical protein VYE68_11345 [Acidobacteriota bacterium]|nr:hypothetical protein [Acidobacteriota bacterium]